jgi:hypothetical protein
MSLSDDVHCKVKVGGLGIGSTELSLPSAKTTNGMSGRQWRSLKQIHGRAELKETKKIISKHTSSLEICH